MEKSIDDGFKFLIFSLFFFCFFIMLYNGYDNYKNLIYSNNEEILRINNDICSDEKKELDKTEEDVKKDIVHVIPYEEKYLIQVRNMKNEYVFTNEELKNEQSKLKELIEDHNKKQTHEILELKNKIRELNYEFENLNNEESSSEKDISLIKQIADSVQNEININKSKLEELQSISSKATSDFEKQARQFIIDEQLKQYKTRFIIELTPLGNVLMFYNHDKLAFDYYSDSAIPYRFLETIARKYVMIYKYRPLYIDMEEELKDYEKKLNANAMTIESKPDGQQDDKHKQPDAKKNIFAKFKSYNKEAGTGKVNTAPPPKNSIPQNRIIVQSSLNSNSDKILLKEKSNRYSYQGKFANFNILQKIDKKIINKRYGMTFADFKKIKPEYNIS